MVAEDVVSGERAQLRADRVRDLRAPVTDVREPEAGGGVEVLAAVGVPDPAALAADEDELVPVDLPTPADGVVELISMWVRPDARGRGVGDALIEAVEAWARRTGAATVRLAVAEGNDRAEALYRRHGYRRTGEVDHMPDGVRREYVLAKALDREPGGGPVRPGQAGPVRPSGDGRSRIRKTCAQSVRDAFVSL